MDVQMLDSLLARNLPQALVRRLGPALARREGQTTDGGDCGTLYIFRIVYFY